MATNEKCGAVLGEMVAGGVRTPLTCGLAKGHVGAHVPAAPATPAVFPRQKPYPSKTQASAKAASASTQTKPTAKGVIGKR